MFTRGWSAVLSWVLGWVQPYRTDLGRDRQALKDNEKRGNDHKVDSPVSGTIRGQEVPDFIEPARGSENPLGGLRGTLSAQVRAEPDLGRYLPAVLPLWDGSVAGRAGTHTPCRWRDADLLQHGPTLLGFPAGFLAFRGAATEALALEFLVAMLAGDIEALRTPPHGRELEARIV
jgi:hypothetical protein